MNKTDMRVIKTKNSLYNALLELMKEKAFEEIKVSDICSKASINRSTFYAHYDDKYELLSAWVNDSKEALINKLASNKTINSTKVYYLEMIKLFLNHIESQKETYLAIANKNKNSILTDIIYGVIDNELLTRLEESNRYKGVPSNIISKFYLGAIVNVSIYWMYNSNKYTKEEIIKYLDNLLPEA